MNINKVILGILDRLIQKNPPNENEGVITGSNEMNTFFQNYWSLFLDFIVDFQKVTYKGIPLPLLSTFQGYLDDEIKLQMTQPEFRLCLKNNIQFACQIQPSFDYLLNSIGENRHVLKGNGKVIIHEGDLLRFPRDYMKSFDHTKTLLLVSSEVKNKIKYINYLRDLKEVNSVELLDEHRRDIREFSSTIIPRVESLFSEYSTHPVYSNKNFSKKFIDDIPKMLSLLVAYENLLDSIPVSGIVVGNTSGMYSRILTIVARSKGIPSICTQHGIIGNELGYLPTFATVHAVFGDYEKDWYLRQGVKKRCLEITGHPRFDQIFTKQHMSKSAFNKELGLDSNKKLVFIPTNMTRDLALFNPLIKALIENPQINVLIRAHPSEKKHLGIKNYELLSSQNTSIKLVKTIELYDIIANVDIVVQDLSTVGLEAMLFGKPVFFIRKKSYYDTNDRYYYDLMGEFSDNDPEMLTDKINQFINNPNRQIGHLNKQKEFLAYAYPHQLSGGKMKELITKLTDIQI